MPASHTATENLQLYRRLLSYVLPYKGVFIAALAGMLVVAAGDAAIVAMLKPIIDQGLIVRDNVFIQWVPLFLIGLGLMRAGGTFVDSYCMSWVARRVIQDLRQLMFERFLHAPAHYFDQNSSGSLASRLIYDVEQIANASTTAFRVLFRDFFKVIFLLTWMFYINWKLSLLFLIMIPIIFMIFKVSSRGFRTTSWDIQNCVSAIMHISKEALQGQHIVKVFNAYDYQRKVFLKANNRHRQQTMKQATILSASVPLTVFLSGIGIAAVVWVALGQSITPGVFSSYIASMVMLSKPITGLSKLNLVIQSGLAGAQSVFGTVDLEQERDDGKVELKNITKQVRFRNVSFHYGNDKTVLNEISFDIKAGTTVALVGASGAGKSTVASLLLRFYAPTGGEISIDGGSISSYTLESLRANTAIVTQEITLFDDTIRNNITYGSSDKIDPHKLNAAATAAYVTEFTEGMAEGLDTVIGEQGMRLSGGQRQRIAIARALYKDAPLLIMDEATSSLDGQSESHIQQAIALLVKNRTSLIIAHRLSTIEHADMILVLEDGRIVQHGTHTELLARAGRYARLHATMQSPKSSHVA